MGKFMFPKIILLKLFFVDLVPSSRADNAITGVAWMLRLRLGLSTLAARVSDVLGQS